MSNPRFLFDQQLPPLADRVRPKTIADFVGQSHLLGQGKILSRIAQTKSLFSLILWGPPGSGKTSLARILSQTTDATMVELSAVSSGVRDLRKVIEQGRTGREMGKRTILFIDEIHRFSKAQQDALLHAVEEGDITLIGATTENPSFEIINPLLSRCRVLVLRALSTTQLNRILDHAFTVDIKLSAGRISLPDPVRQHLLSASGGDARKMLNTLDICLHLVGADGVISLDILNEALQQNPLLYDKSGDYHYDAISAFIKAVRGSDPDAAVYWLVVMLEGGEKPEFIARRLVIQAAEDVGNADPNALPLASAGFQAVHQIGMPESAIILSQVTTYLAAAPKSNAAYMALKAAQKVVTANKTPTVPVHLRNAPTDLMKQQGFGKDYVYPHDHPDHFIRANYFPDGVTGGYYMPSRMGYEAFIRKRLAALWQDRYSEE
ncbi:MAG: replication-associated recombination protein A [Fidelibacterota bacterium]